MLVLISVAITRLNRGAARRVIQAVDRIGAPSRSTLGAIRDFA